MFSRDRSKHPCRRSPATLHGVVFDILVGSDNHAGLALSFLMMIVVANGKSGAAARLRPEAAAPVRLRFRFAQSCAQRVEWTRTTLALWDREACSCARW